MEPSKSHPANDAAVIALHTALRECSSAGLNPAPYASTLTQLVTFEVRKAMAEMAEHQTHGGPTAIRMLTQAVWQNVYFADAGRLAAQSLLQKLNIRNGQQIH
jgi:hypothetical protein